MLWKETCEKDNLAYFALHFARDGYGLGDERRHNKPESFRGHGQLVSVRLRSRVYTTPQPWISLGGNTGLVGNTNAQNWQNLQVGNGWAGGFTANMGLVYNGVSTLGNGPTSIGIYLDQPVNAIGAWIDANYIGPFTATLTLLDSNLNPFFTYSVAGVSDFNLGTAPFIGAIDFPQRDIWGAIFDTTADGFHDHDFAIGTMKLNTPEPSTMLLVGPSLIAMGGLLRRRLARKSQEVL